MFQEKTLFEQILGSGHPPPWGQISARPPDQNPGSARVKLIWSKHHLRFVIFKIVIHRTPEFEGAHNSKKTSLRYPFPSKAKKK